MIWTDKQKKEFIDLTPQQEDAIVERLDRLIALIEYLLLNNSKEA